MSETQEHFRKRVINFWLANRDEGKVFTAKHFVAERKRDTVVYKIIRMYEQRGSVETRRRSGRPAVIMTKRRENVLRAMFDNKHNVHQRRAANKFNCSQPYICYKLKQFGIRKYKKKKCPNIATVKRKN